VVSRRQTRIKNIRAEKQLFIVRGVVAAVIAGVLLLAEAGRLFYLQVLKHDYYAELSQGNRIRTEPITPSRGLILDRHGVVLADNMPAFQIELVREQVGDAQALDVALTQGEYAPQLGSRPRVAGEDLILGLDIRVQKVAEEALAGKRGSIVALDPRTGDVIALASTPGFDPNDFVRGLSVAQYGALQNNIDKPLLNRALRGAYPPGSTVKPLYALAAQKYGVLSPLRIGISNHPCGASLPTT
jgi:cell division protein FtsI/penicillin-binding protein 2